MGDWRYELAGLSAQERLRAVKAYEKVAEDIAVGRLTRSPQEALRAAAAAEGVDGDHPWIVAAAEELEQSRRPQRAAAAGLRGRQNTYPATRNDGAGSVCGG